MNIHAIEEGSDDVENKTENPGDVSEFEKSFLKKGKNEVNAKICFVSLVRMIVNVFLSSH